MKLVTTRLKEYCVAGCRVRLLVERDAIALRMREGSHLFPPGTTLKIAHVLVNPNGKAAYVQLDSRTQLAFQPQYEGRDWELVL